MAALECWSRLYVALLLCECLLWRRALGKDENCKYELNSLWTASLRDSPLSATPTFFDVDGDGYGDIVAPSFSGEVWSIHGESGHIVDNWPFYLEERAFHASALIYDVDKDGILEFLLTTSDGEILFLHTNNSLLHGETIKIPPLRVRRHWYKLDKAYLEKISEELSKQLGDSGRLQTGPGENQERVNQAPATDNLHQHSQAFSEFESRYGRHADPLYSRHQRGNLVSGVDPGNHDTVFVDPHVLATPTLADTNGDGHLNELIVPVSYYFDPFYYGEPHNLGKLGGLDRGELVHYVAGGVVIIDLNTGALISQKVLGLTEASDSQPAYALSTPTVVRLFPGVGGAKIIVAMATGKVNVLDAGSLESEPGFPVRLDSVSATIAVADLFQDGALELVVGDNSGNVYCIDSHGNRRWEYEAGGSIQSEVRFIDFNGDSHLDVVFVTIFGSLFVLHGTSGTPFPGFPIRLNIHTQSSPIIMHLTHSHSGGGGERGATLTTVITSMTNLYLIDLASQCIDSIETDSVIMTALSGDVDPYNAGIELLTVGLDGKIVCYSPSLTEMSSQEMSLQTWAVDLTGHARFTHRRNSIAVLLPWEHDTRVDLHGNSFTLEVKVMDNNARRSKEISVTISVGRKYLLYNGTLPLYQKVTTHTLTVTTPPEPLAAFLTATFCTEHLQCQSLSRHVRFNLSFRQTLQWYLCVPFFALVTAFLWLLRDADFEPLPGAVYGSTNRKSL